MANKIWKEYVDEIHNMDANYEKVRLKTKGVSSMKKKMLNMAAVFVAIVVIGATSSQLYAKIKWNVEFKEYQNRPVEEAKGNLDSLRESDYAEVLNMDYVVQDGVSVKVDSILLTDDCFDANLEFKFAEEREVNSQTFRYGFAVYDENKNIYGIFSGITSKLRVGDKDNTVPFLYEELGIKYDKKDLYSKELSDGASAGPVEVNEQERTIKANINLRAKDVFPKSKKLYIRVFDLGYDMYDLDSVNLEKHMIGTKEYFEITDAKWIFEIDVPDKFYERNTLELKLANKIPDFEIEKATLTETSLVLTFKSQAYRDLITAGKDFEGNFGEAMTNMLNVTNSEGKMYQDISSGSKREDAYKITYDAGKKDLEKKLFVNFTVDGKKYTSELIEK